MSSRSCPLTAGILPELEAATDSLNTVTVSGNLGVDVPIGTLKSIWRQAQLEDR